MLKCGPNRLTLHSLIRPLLSLTFQDAMSAVLWYFHTNLPQDLTGQVGLSGGYKCENSRPTTKPTTYPEHLTLLWLSPVKGNGTLSPPQLEVQYLQVRILWSRKEAACSSSSTLEMNFQVSNSCDLHNLMLQCILAHACVDTWFSFILDTSIPQYVWRPLLRPLILCLSYILNPLFAT